MENVKENKPMKQIKLKDLEYVKGAKRTKKWIISGKVYPINQWFDHDNFCIVDEDNDYYWTSINDPCITPCDKDGNEVEVI